MLSLNNAALRRGAQLLFEQSTFTIHRGEKVGLIGANGSGKSSFFKLLLGELDTDQGALDLPTNLRIAHMAQEVPASNILAVDYVLEGDDRLTEINQRLQNASDDEIATLYEQMDSIDGYTARARAEQLLMGLGFAPSEFEQPLSTFSGGWRIRLNLAQSLMSPADLLLLDEPTNHLDLETIIWLTTWIEKFDGTLLLISHDREFLDQCVNHIAYLHHERLELFTGNYTEFENIKAARLALQQASYAKQQKEIAHMQDFVRRFRAKASKARQAQSRIKALERMELIAPAHVDSPFSFQITSQDKVSTPLLALADAQLGYGNEVVIRDVNLTLLPGDRIGLLGINGAGKTTLIKTLCNEIDLVGGTRTEGANLSVAYFSQHQLDDLKLQDSALEHVVNLGRLLGDVPGELAVRNFLGGFNFHGDKVLEPVAHFSGGEKARLALALIAYTEPNLLLMDEPTNHLDIDMRQALTMALQSFAGAIVLVSHDRHLMANTVDQLMLIKDGRLDGYSGDVADYGARVKGGEPSQKTGTAPSASKEKKAQTPRPGKAIRQLKTRIGTLDKQMARLNRKLSEVNKQLADPEIYADAENPDLQRLLREQIGYQSDLDVLEEEWLSLTNELETLQE